MDQRRLHRRDVVKLLPMAVFGTALAGFGRVLTACTQAVAPGNDREPVDTGGTQKPSTTAPTDSSEFVPKTADAPPPVNANDAPPTVPNQAWESRVSQLQEVQNRVYGVAAFSATAPGIFVGKERSHVPQVTSAVENGMKKVTVLVEHVMGANALPVADAGPDTGPGSGTGGGDGGGGGKDAGADAKADAAPPPPAVDSGPPPIHYITTQYLVATINGKDTVVGLWEFASTDPAPPSVKFTMPAGVTQVVAYENCTLHGLWKSDVISV